MPNFFYLDANGQKQGPVTPQQLKALATQGAITPSTQLATDGGHKGTAGQIKGLFASSKAEESPFTVAAPSSVDVPVAEGRKGSLVVTLVGVLAIAVVGGIGWFVVSGVSSSSGTSSPSPVPARQAVASPPVVQVPEAVAVLPARTGELPSEEKLKEQVRYVNQYESDGSLRKYNVCNLSDEEEDEVVRWLLRAEKAGAEKLTSLSFSGVSLFLRAISDTEIQMARSGTGRSILDPIDQYILNKSHGLYLTRIRESYSEAYKIVESMLPESNRLSGNKYDEQEKARLAGKDLFGK